jgi:hypothetical protein
MNPLERTARWSRSGRSVPVVGPKHKQRRRLFAYIKKAARQAYRVASKASQPR